MIQAVKRFGVANVDRCIAAGNVVVAAVIAFAAFRALPVRSPWVTVPALALIALLVASAAGLGMRAPWAARATRAAGLALFWVGLVVVGVLVLGMVFSRAVSGAAAWPSAGLFALALLVVLPYTVIYGFGLLAWAPAAAAAATVAAPARVASEKSAGEDDPPAEGAAAGSSS